MSTLHIFFITHTVYEHLTYTVPPEIPQTAAASASHDVDASIVAAAGVFVAVTWGAAALGELSPQTGTIVTHHWHLMSYWTIF